MLTGPNCSGFGWDPDKKIVTAEKAMWDAYIHVFFIFCLLVGAYANIILLVYVIHIILSNCKR